MQCAKLTDDELWRAVTQNTDELSALLCHLDADFRIRIAGTPCARSRYSEAVNKFECEHRGYIAELRHRYHCPEKSIDLNREQKWFRIDARSVKIILAHIRGITPATFIQYGLVAAFISVLIVGAFSLRVH